MELSERAHRCDGKNIVITGANTGIGLETARELLARGGNVIILCRNQARMDAALEDLKKTSDSVQGLLLDLKSFDSVKKVSEEIHTKVDHIDILIMNAGSFQCDVILQFHGTCTIAPCHGII